MSIDEQIAYVSKIVVDIIKKKARIHEVNSTRNAMQKLGFLYYAELGQMDFWELSLSKEKLKNKARKKFFVPGADRAVTEEEIEICHNEITNLITKESDEPPIMIGYFAIPEFTYGAFKIGCVAKIDNNGSTFVFADDKDLLGCVL
jgi:hypothetical protein